MATNALLERKGEPTVLVITKGFADALRIAYQNRPRIFDRRILLPEVLYQRVIEVSERISADGEVLVPLDENAITQELEKAHEDGFEAVAVVCMHGYRYPAHERRIGAIARAAGFTQVSESHRTSPLMKLVSRGDTTVVDAYLSPILRRYVTEVAQELQGVPLLFMQSNGGLTDAASFRGKDSIVSGPAGGIVGMARTAAKAGFEKVIGFDMGGTSTDVSHFAGEFEREYETQVAGVRMRAPMLAIHTVAAGGGSVLHFDGSRYRVGPDSAGADPGPACYRRGGPLTVTDANVLLGRIQPDYFPKVFGTRGDAPLDADVTRARFEELSQQITATAGDDRGPEQVAAGFIEIAVANMANAIKKISVQRGYDVTEYVLNVFGGAGGQHACAVADALGMTRVLIHPLAGVLSAYGIGLADVIAMREQAVEAPLTTDLIKSLPATTGPLERQGRAEVEADGGEGGPARRITATHRAHLRYQGTDTAVIVPVGPLEQMTAAFEAEYARRFSFLMRDKPVIVEAVSVEVTAARQEPEGSADTPPRSDSTKERPVSSAQVPMFTGGAWAEVDLFPRAGLRPGHAVDGPAVITEELATTVVEPGWRAVVSDRGDLLLSRVTARPARAEVGTNADPVMLEIFNNLFMSVAEQMGVRLQATAHSVNIKERLDFSCAVFDADGGLIANAPHMPVHLGSMGESIKMVIKRNPRIRRGDVYVLNDPYHGGTHLPDITVVTPVFAPETDDIWFYVASRGHHAEIGGVSPGSMPASSTRVEEEGVLIDNWLLVENGQLKEAETIRPAGARRVPVPRPGHEPGRPARPDRRQFQGHRRAAPHGGTFRAGRRDGLHGPRPAERGRGGQPRDHRPARRRVRLRDGQRRGGQGRGPRQRRGQDRRDRLHRDLSTTSGQFQCALKRGHGGRAVRLPDPGRRRHPAQLRLPAAADGDHPAGLDAVPAVPGRGRGGQRGDLPGRHRGAVRGAGRDGGGVRDDEQRDLRQPGVPVLRDGGQRLGRG